MHSQEDYLDNLLKDMAAREDVGDIELQPQETIQSEDGLWQDTEMNPEAETWTDADVQSGEETVYEDASVPDLDAVTSMTEDEIERLLSAGVEPEFEDAEVDALPLDEDVMKMLEESDDSDLQDIQDLLQKSDDNEPVDESISELLNDEFMDDEDLEAKIFGDDEEVNASSVDRKRRALEKKALAQEKRQAVKVKKEQKKEEAARKAAQKAAQKAEKEAAKKAKKARKVQEVQEEKPDLFDTAILDSIVSEAGKVSQEPEENFSDMADNFSDVSEFQGDLGDTFSDVSELSGDLGDTFSDVSELSGDLGDSFSDVSEFSGDLEDSFSDVSDISGETGDFLSDMAGLQEEDETEVPDEGKESSKKGFFSKMMDFLTEEDEEENENIKLTQENQGILNELDSEEGEEGKTSKKSGKKEKVKKEKKKKEKVKQEKPKKPPKPKKEKKPKEVSLIPEKKLSFKKVFPIILIGVSVGVLLFVFVNSASDYTDKKVARESFYKADYETCYQNLFGKDLDETEQIMFGKSESILRIRLWIREYEILEQEGSEVEALDSLIQNVVRYPQLYEYASKWNASPEVSAGYATLLNILSEKYGLTEKEVLKIAAEPSDLEYTKIVTAIAGGKSYDSWNQPEAPKGEETSDALETPGEPPMEDVLPEEGELGQGNFVDNQ